MFETPFPKENPISYALINTRMDGTEQYLFKMADGTHRVYAAHVKDRVRQDGPLKGIKHDPGIMFEEESF